MYIGPFKLNVRQATGLIPHWPEGDAIPKLIHQTYRSHDVTPEIAANIEHLKALNPGWTYRLYDDAEIVAFIRDAYGERVLRAFQSIDPRYGASRADLFRYLLLYKEGGVYLDIKSSADQPFEAMLRPDDRFILTEWDSSHDLTAGWGGHTELEAAGGRELQQWHIIAAPGHPFLRRVIETVLYNLRWYVPELHGVGWRAGMLVTGPYTYTLAIAPIRDRHPHRQVRTNRDIGLRYTIFDDARRHHGLLGPHYSRLTLPFVRPTPLSRMVRGVASGAIAARNALFRRGGRML